MILLGLSRAMVRRRTSPRKKRTAYQGRNAGHTGFGAAPARRGGAWVILVLGALVVVNLYVFVWDKKSGVRAIRAQAEAKTAPAMTIPSGGLPPAPAAELSAAPAPAPAPAKPPAIEGKVGKSDTLGMLLKHNGLSAGEADEIIRALSGALDFRKIRAGQSFRIERGGDGRVVRFELELGKARHVRVDRKPSGELAASVDEP